MGIGDLVKNIRASIGVPKGTVGLITNKQRSNVASGEVVYIYDIQWVSRSAHGRRLERDLEVIG